MSKYLPIALIVLSNIFYHICSKQTPNNIHPMASLTITYIIGAISSIILYFTMSKGGNLLNEFRHLNWTSFVLGIAIVGLEAGYIYLYKAGWNINSAQLAASSILAIALIVVGYLLYREAITLTKVIGVIICLIGLMFINK